MGVSFSIESLLEIKRFVHYKIDFTRYSPISAQSNCHSIQFATLNPKCSLQKVLPMKSFQIIWIYQKPLRLFLILYRFEVKNWYVTGVLIWMNWSFYNSHCKRPFYVILYVKSKRCLFSLFDEYRWALDILILTVYISLLSCIAMEKCE